MADPHIRTDAYAHVAALDASINATDRVYRNAATKRLVKVRVKRIPNAPPGMGFGVVVVELSGAVCDEDGCALAHERYDYMIAPSHRMTFVADTPIDFDRVLDIERLKVCAATERAAEIEEAAAKLPAAGN